MPDSASVTRVLHVLYALETGGLEKGVATTASHASSDIRHEVLCLTVTGESAKLFPESVPIHELKLPPGNSLASLRNIRRKLREVAPDVVHTRNWAGMDAVLAAIGTGIPVVHGEHGWDVGDPDGSSRKRRFIRRALQRGVREYTCVSGHMERWLRDDVGIRKPITQIYNGVDTERFRPRTDREGFDLEPDAFVVGIVARLDPIKDHETLLAAFDKLLASHPGAVLLIAGDGPREEALRARAGRNVRFLGHRRDVPEVMSACDVFVLPSRNEGVSNTILEAMATGLPIVASRVGGTPELVDDGVHGVLFEPGDVHALGDALRLYASDRDRVAGDGAASRARALERFSIPAMVHGYESVWRRVAGASERDAGSRI